MQRAYAQAWMGYQRSEVRIATTTLPHLLHLPPHCSCSRLDWRRFRLAQWSCTTGAWWARRGTDTTAPRRRRPLNRHVKLPSAIEREKNAT